MKKNEKNLIMGVAYGYEFEKIRPFVASLKEINFKGAVVIVADDNMVIPAVYCDCLDIRVVNEKGLRRSVLLRAVNKGLSFPYLRFFVKKALGGINKVNENAFLDAFISVYHVVNARIAFYYKYLKDNKFDNVFLTDVRDVVFQADPFDNFLGGCNVFNENETITIADCQWNSSWIREGYGEKQLSDIADKEIYCVGTILADYESIMLLLVKMLKACVDWKGRMNIYGPDTGSFNYLIHNGLIDNIVKRKNGDIVLTVSPETYDKIKIEQEGIVYNSMRPAVIHQYDRLASLINHYEIKALTAFL